MVHRKYGSAACLAILGLSVLTSCKDAKPHATTIPRAESGKLALVAGTGFTGLDERTELPGAQIPVPTGIASYQDGSIIALVNGDGGTLLRLAKSGQAEPFEYYREKRASGDKYVKFDTANSLQKGWLGQQNSSSMIKRPNGDLWIYSNRWIAAITADSNAVVLGQLKLPEKKNEFDYETRIFNGMGADVLLTREGNLYKVEPNLTLTPYTPPGNISNTTAASGDNKHLLLGSKSIVYRIDGNRIVGKDKLQLGDDQSAGNVVGITTDSRGGYFAGTSAGVIFYAAAGKAPVLLAGIAHKPEASFGGIDNCPPAGHMRLVSNPLAAELGNPESMLLDGDQLYIADAGCNRIYALGVPRT